MTLFRTPFLTPLLRYISIAVLKLWGWTPALKFPETEKKYVIIAAPHTSNWDYLLFLLFVFQQRMDFRVLIKHTWFFPPVGWVLRYAGAVPVNRKNPAAQVRKVAEMFAAADEMVLVITPEATRSPTRKWKTGFYHIAKAANVPIGLGLVNAPVKQIEIAGYIHPKNIDEDLAAIRDFYETRVHLGIHPEKGLPPDFGKP